MSADTVPVPPGIARELAEAIRELAHGFLLTLDPGALADVSTVRLEFAGPHLSVIYAQTDRAECSAVGSPYVLDVGGVPQPQLTVELELGLAAFGALTSSTIKCSEIWLTRQPNGRYALGVVTATPPAELGLMARAVETDDRRERFTP